MAPTSQFECRVDDCVLSVRPRSLVYPGALKRNMLVPGTDKEVKLKAFMYNNGVNYTYKTIFEMAVDSLI